MPDKYLFYAVSILISIGVVASYSLSTYTTIYFSANEFNFALKQFAYALISILIMWYLAKADPDKWFGKIGITLFLVGFFLMFIMHYLPSSIVTAVGGAKRWIKLFGISIAPVEFFKIGFIYFLAWSFNRKITHQKGVSVWIEAKMFLPYLLVFFVAVILIAVLQNDLGQVVVTGATLVVMAHLAGGSLKFFMSSIFAGFVVFISIIFLSDHRIDRILTWWTEAQHWVLEFFPDFIADQLRYDSPNSAYQTSHSLNAISNGGVFGTGIGDGIYKLGFLSEVHTDFVLAGISEEIGSFFTLVVVLIFLFAIQRIFRIANRSQERVYFLFNAGIGLMISFAFLINSYGITAMVPIKGIAVPFLSYGGSGLIATSIAIGMVLMTSKKIFVPNKKAEHKENINNNLHTSENIKQNNINESSTDNFQDFMNPNKKDNLINDKQNSKELDINALNIGIENENNLDYQANRPIYP